MKFSNSWKYKYNIEWHLDNMQDDITNKMKDLEKLSKMTGKTDE